MRYKENIQGSFGSRLVEKVAYIYELGASGATVRWAEKKEWNTEILQRTSDSTLKL